MSIDVAVLGATGLVGERMIRMLAGHPSLRLREVVASPRSTGRQLGEVLGDTGLPPAAAGLCIRAPRAPLCSRIVLSALPRAAAAELEPEYANRGHLVCSNAAALRADARVPLVIPEVNADALELLASQPWRHAGGAIVTNPNCVVSGLALALAPLHAAFAIEGLTVVTLQALSGAGREGIAAWHLLGNVVPHIEGEADKIPAELHKILGSDFPVAVAVNRVPVVDGHLATVFVRLRTRVRLDAIATALREFRGHLSARQLPTAPAHPLQVHDRVDRPQPRLDLDAGAGMTVSVGNLAAAPGHDVRFSMLVHNLVRGAAGACLLNAELLARELSAAGRPSGRR